MKRIPIIFFCLLTSVLLKAQNFPIYSQYFLDPYLYNVGAVGISGFTEINLNYRQQWAGIEDAPVTSTFNIQIPTKGNVAFGINVYSDKAVLLRSSASFVSFGYRLPLGESHFLNFGLAAGAGMSNIDISQIGDLTDPAISSAYSTSYYLDGQFGMYYQFKKFSAGVSMPKLFGTKAFSPEQFQIIKLAPFENMIYSLSYKIDLPNTSLAFTPYLLYRSGMEIQKQVEATGILSFKDLFYVGGSYRIDYGASIFLGFGFKSILKFGYGYEMATAQTTSLGQGTHEFQLKFMLGKQKRKQKKKSTPTKHEEVQESDAPPSPVIVEEKQVYEEAPIEVEDVVIPLVIVVPKDTVVTKEADQPIKQQAKEEEVVVVTEPQSVQIAEFSPLTPGIYIVVGVFSSKQNAQKHSAEIERSGFDNEIRTNYEGNFYIIIDSPETMKSAKEFRKKTISADKFDFKNAWILEIE